MSYRDVDYPEQVQYRVYERDNEAFLKTRNFLRGEGTRDSTIELDSRLKIFKNPELLQAIFEMKWE
jgi:hypothetical protein